jgi:hypothetical protein
MSTPYARRRPEATALYRIVQQSTWRSILPLAREGDWDGHTAPASVEREFRRSLERGNRCRSWASSGLLRTPTVPCPRGRVSQAPNPDRLRWKRVAPAKRNEFAIVWAKGVGLMTGLAPEVAIAFAHGATLLAGEEVAFELDVPRLAQEPRQIDAQALDHRAEP